MKRTNVQDIFLINAKEAQTLVTLFLTNGVRFQEKIVGFDAFSILFEISGHQQLVMKSMISTLVPSDKIPMFAKNHSEV